MPDCEKDACDPGFTECKIIYMLFKNVYYYNINIFVFLILEDNYCYSCELNCLECSDVDTCTRCRGGYYLEDADCH